MVSDRSGGSFLFRQAPNLAKGFRALIRFRIVLKLQGGCNKFSVRYLIRQRYSMIFPLSSAKTHPFHANLESSQGKNPSCISSKSSDLFDFRFTWQSRYLIGVTASLQPPYRRAQQDRCPLIAYSLTLGDFRDASLFHKHVGSVSGRLVCAYARPEPRPYPTPTSATESGAGLTDINSPLFLLLSNTI